MRNSGLYEKSLFSVFQGIFASLKVYLHLKKITSQNVSSETQLKRFFYFVEQLWSVLKIFKVFNF